MTELNPDQLREEAKRHRQLARKFDELADLLESGGSSSQYELVDRGADSGEIGFKRERESKGDAKRKVLAKLGLAGVPVRPSELIKEEREKEDGLHEQTIYAVLRRSRGNEIEKKKDGYVLKNHSWVFTYGINMNTDHLRAYFKQSGYDFDSLVIDSRVGSLQKARLSWKNRSRNWAGGTATFDEEESSELYGVAFLVNSEGLKAFDKKESPRYIREEQKRQIILEDGHTIECFVYQVSPANREPDDIAPKSAYLKQMLAAATENSLPAWYIQQLESLLER